MGNDSVHLVRLRTDDRTIRIYAVARDRRDVLNEVLEVVPEGWSASLLSEQLTPRQIAALNLRPGEVRDITQ
jgi:hypothetical protein